MAQQRLITVLGTGAFGSCITKASSLVKGNRILLLARSQEAADYINTKRRNPDVYKDFVYPDSVRATADIKEALGSADLIFSCLPTQVVPSFLEENKRLFRAEAPFVSCSKGMVISHRKFLSEIYGSTFRDRNNYAVLSGPSFAEEVIRGDPTLVSVASNDDRVAKFVQNTVNSTSFRAYTINDVIGIEVSGALKNVLAIGAGIARGSGYGFNPMAAIVTRGAKEIKALAIRYGADPSTINGLAGIGDIMLTAFGSLSRNQNFGIRLAKGETREDILKDLKTVEGVPTLEAIHAYKTAEGLDLPIIEGIYQIVYHNRKISEAIHLLMNRAPEAEFPPSAF